MPIKYLHAPDIKEIAEEVVERLSWNHILLEHVAFIRSIGSKSRGTIARCHALGKAMQIGMKRDKSFYLIEVISKRFDNLPVEEQLKVIIHELMHIPNTFGGGFKHHNVVNDSNVEKVYQHYTKLKQKSEGKPEENSEGKKGWF
jgi:predicted metallopeptidase